MIKVAQMYGKSLRGQGFVKKQLLRSRFPDIVAPAPDVLAPAPDRLASDPEEWVKCFLSDLASGEGTA